MLLGRVIGEVWATVKDERLEGRKFLIVQQVDLAYKPLPNFVVAVDALETGPGEIVLVAQGSSARQTAHTKDRPVDAVIMAIVDRIEVIPEREIEKDFERRRSEIEARLNALKET